MVLRYFDLRLVVRVVVVPVLAIGLLVRHRVAHPLLRVVIGRGRRRGGAGWCGTSRRRVDKVDPGLQLDLVLDTVRAGGRRGRIELIRGRDLLRGVKMQGISAGSGLGVHHGPGVAVVLVHVARLRAHIMFSIPEIDH